LSPVVGDIEAREETPNMITVLESVFKPGKVVINYYFYGRRKTRREGDNG